MIRSSPKTPNRELGTANTIATRAPAWVGASLFLVTAPAHMFPVTDAPIAVAAIALALIRNAYIGFGTADGRPRVFWSERGVSILFGAAAVPGLLRHWSALPLGLALPAIWDILHQKMRDLERVPSWYIPICVIYDLLAAACLILLYGFWI